jgi:hypothetical protein
MTNALDWWLIGVMKQDDAATATAMKKGRGETCRVRAACKATGAMRTAVAAWLMISVSREVSKKKAARTA